MEAEATQVPQQDENRSIQILYLMRIYYAYLKSYGMNYRQILIELNKNNSSFQIVSRLFFEKLHDEHEFNYLIDDITYPVNFTYEEMLFLNDKIKDLYDSILEGRKL
jgi:hypothetical protein